MEDPRESQRLAEKVDAANWVSRFLLPHLRSPCRVLDVGCGPGVIAMEIARRFPSAEVAAIDASQARVSQCQMRLASLPNACAQRADATFIPFPDESFDLVFCRFLLEYLPNRAAALHEMTRVCKPGGTVLLQDLDGQLTWHYPPDATLERKLETVLRELGKSGFDPFVGRKLFSLARNAGLTRIDVRVDPYHLLAGTPCQRELELWRLKLEIAEPAIRKALGSTEAAAQLKESFIDYLSREDTLTYSVLFTVCGQKAAGLRLEKSTN